MRFVRTSAFIILGLLQSAGAQDAPRTWPYEAAINVFEIHSDVPIPDAKLLDETLQHLQSDMASILSLPASTESIHVVLFGQASEYTRYMQHYFPTIVQRRAIFLQDRGPGMLFTFWHDEIETDLRHEAAHAVLNQTGVQLPLWLDEGLAEYFEVARESRYARSPYLPTVAAKAQEGQIPSLIELEMIEQIEQFTEDHYRDSWAWVHLMVHRRPQTRQLLVDYLNKARQKIPQPSLVRQITQLLEDPEREYQSHFSQLIQSSGESGRSEPAISRMRPNGDGELPPLVDRTPSTRLATD